MRFTNPFFFFNFVLEALLGVRAVLMWRGVGGRRLPWVGWSALLITWCFEA